MVDALNGAASVASLLPFLDRRSGRILVAASGGSGSYFLPKRREIIAPQQEGLGAVPSIQILLNVYCPE